MTVPTLVLSPRFSTDSNDLWRAALARKWNVHRAIRMQGPDPQNGPLCVYGESAFSDIMAERLRLGLLEPPEDWLARLPLKYVNRHVWAGTVADLPRVTERSFIKPASDKLFDRAVYERGTDVATKWVDPTCPILVSDVVAWEVEVRLHVLDRRIVAAGDYLIIGNEDPDGLITEAKAWAQTLLEDPDLDLPSAVVIDVGFIDDKGWSVVEANSAYMSGVYNEASRDAVLDTILRSAGPLALVSETDRKYLRT